MTITRSSETRRIESERAFRKQIESLGGYVVGEYVNTLTAIKVVCPNGHIAYPLPGNVRGRGFIQCPSCRHSETARIHSSRARFVAYLASIGGELVGEFTGMANPVAVRCSCGKVYYPNPNAMTTQKTHGCVECGQRRLRQMHLTAMGGFAQFMNIVESKGGRVVATEWLGSRVGHQIECPNGHITSPSLDNIRQGRGICRFCSHKVWDCFYLVFNPETDIHKFGVTSGNPSPRLANHRAHGFNITQRLIMGIPYAHALEQGTRRVLTQRGISPVMGYEYYRFPNAESVLPNIINNIITEVSK